MRRRVLLAACTLVMGMSTGSILLAGGTYAASATYTVQAGDTLSSVAQRFGTSVGALERVNGISATALLHIGEVLELPGAAATTQATAGSYIVRNGDTLSSIAASLGVSVAALEAANGLGATSVLQIGQHLTVPGSDRHAAGSDKSAAYAPRIYVVRAGDTLSSISKRFGISLSRLYALNGLSPNSVLQIGQHLHLSALKSSHAVAGPIHRPASAKTQGATTRYTVQAGDTLSSIAQHFGVTLATLQQLNPSVNPSTLQIGQTLTIPSGSSGSSGSSGASQSVSLGQQVANDVQRYLGVPYVWGGASPSGFDCSGLVQYVFGQLGISIPRDATDQYYAGQPVAASDLQPGDVVFFDTEGGISHDGIYIGNGQFVDAPVPGRSVEVENLNLPYWQDTYIGARSFGGA